MKLTRNREKQQGTKGACLNVLGANVVKKLHRRAALLAVKQTPAGFTSYYFAHTSAHVVHTLRTRYAHMAHTLRTRYAHMAHTLRTHGAHIAHTLRTLLAVKQTPAWHTRAHTLRRCQAQLLERVLEIGHRVQKVVSHITTSHRLHALRMRTPYVYPLCVPLMCTPYVYPLCVPLMCTPYVYPLDVRFKHASYNAHVSPPQRSHTAAFVPACVRARALCACARARVRVRGRAGVRVCACACESCLTGKDVLLAEGGSQA